MDVILKLDVLSEWVSDGQMDLLVFGILVFISAVYLKWNRRHNRLHWGITFAALLVYAICELVMDAVPGRYGPELICLFLGGTAFFIGVGRFVKGLYTIVRGS